MIGDTCGEILSDLSTRTDIFSETRRCNYFIPFKRIIMSPQVDECFLLLDKPTVTQTAKLTRKYRESDTKNDTCFIGCERIGENTRGMQCGRCRYQMCNRRGV